jgi:hypothetical protein
MTKPDPMLENHGLLAGKLDSAREAIKKSARALDAFLMKLEIVSWFLGTALTTLGAMFYGRGEPEIGVPLLCAGFPILLYYAFFLFRKREDPTLRAIEKLELAEQAFSQSKIALSVIGERDRLLIQADDLKSKVATSDSLVSQIKQDLYLLDKHRTAMLVCLQYVNEMASTLVQTRRGKSKNLKDDLAKVFEPLRAVLPKALNVEDGEVWTFSVYSREDEGGTHVMRRLVALSASLAEENDKRAWPLGEGFVGEAWLSGEELIVVPDRDSPTFKSRFHAEGALKKNSDKSLYKSVAIAPIIIGQSSEDMPHKNIVGCVCATSNKANRFLADEADIHALNGALIRQIASITKLLVASWRAKDSPQFIAG